MAAGQTNNPGGTPGQKNLTTVLVPVIGVALIVVLVIVVAATNDGTQPTDKGGKEAVRARGEKPADLSKLADGTAPNADDPGLKDLPGGVRYRDLKEGDGPEVAKGATVTVDYIGWRQSDGHMFDSSWKPRPGHPNGEPMTASLSQLVKGWQIGIPGMKVGGIRKLVIPPDLAYGERGAGADIPPNATLVFQVEVLGTK